MADRPQPHQVQVHPQYRYDAGAKSLTQQRGPSASHVLAVIIILPVGGTLLALAGFTLAGTVIGLLVAIPLFIIFSPVLIPAALVVGLAITGFFISGAFGLTALSSLSWVINSLRQKSPEMADQAKRRLAGTMEYMGQKAKETGQEIQKSGQEIQSRRATTAEEKEGPQVPKTGRT